MCTHSTYTYQHPALGIPYETLWFGKVFQLQDSLENGKHSCFEQVFPLFWWKEWSEIYRWYWSHLQLHLILFSLCQFTCYTNTIKVVVDLVRKVTTMCQATNNNKINKKYTRQHFCCIVALFMFMIMPRVVCVHVK